MAITKNTIVFIGNPGTILVMHIRVKLTDNIVIAITVNGVVIFPLYIEMNLIKKDLQELENMGHVDRYIGSWFTL